MQMLVCPVCKGKLNLSVGEKKGDRIISGTLYCSQCDKTYLIIGGLPHLLPPELEEGNRAKEEETMEYPTKLKEFFESERYWHGDWGYRQGYQDFPIHEQVVELIRSRNPKRVLDVGCAMGFIVQRLMEKGIDAYGVDISNYAISRAPEEVKPYLQVASAHDLPFPSQSFDLIYCASVLEHIPEDFTDKVIAEFKRVAKRAILGIAYKDPYSTLDAHGDISHVNIKDEPWWREKLPPEFEMIDVCVEDGRPYTRGLTKLNLGCFGDYYPSWINIDILPLREQLPPHIRFKQADLRTGLPFCADNSVDLVRMSHLIEHLTLEEAHSLCLEIHRVLKPGALARISTPDASVILKHYTNQDMGYFNQIQPPEYIQAPTEGERLSRLLFSGDYQHRAVYNFEMLKNFLEQAGFVEIEKLSPGSSRSEVMRNETKDQHVEISLTMEAKKESAPPSEIDQFMREKAEGKILTSPPADIPEYWKSFATKKRI